MASLESNRIFWLLCFISDHNSKCNVNFGQNQIFITIWFVFFIFNVFAESVPIFEPRPPTLFHIFSPAASAQTLYLTIPVTLFWRSPETTKTLFTIISGHQCSRSSVLLHDSHPAFFLLSHLSGCLGSLATSTVHDVALWLIITIAQGPPVLSPQRIGYLKPFQISTLRITCSRKKYCDKANRSILFSGLQSRCSWFFTFWSCLGRILLIFHDARQ